MRAREALTNQPGLTDRQLDVLELALRGLTHQQIGDRLYLSLDTVKSEFRRIYAQLSDDSGRAANGAMHAVSRALTRGWMVYDPVSRRLTRPAGRAALPAYADLEGHDPAARPTPAPRTARQRRSDLGW